MTRPPDPPAVAAAADPERDQTRGSTGYRAVFEIPGIIRLLSSALLGRLPIGANSLAILLLVRQQTGSFSSAGLVVGAFALTGAIAAPLQGALLDRFGPPRVLIPFAAAQAAALTGLILVVTGGASLPAILAVAAVAGALVPPISACVRVLWPRLATTPEALETAYTLDATTQEIIFTAGPLLVALMVTVASPAAALFAAVGIQVAGTALFVTTPAIRAWPGKVAQRQPGGALASRPLRIILVTAALIGTGLGALEVGLPALAVTIDSPAASGVLLAAWGLGSMLGGLFYGFRTWSSPIQHRYAALLLLSAILVLPLLWAGSLAVAISFALLAGVPGASILSCQYLLVGRMAPEGALAEAFTWSLAGLIAGIALGSAVGGHLAEVGGAGHAFLLSALATGLASVLALVAARTRPQPNRRATS